MCRLSATRWRITATRVAARPPFAELISGACTMPPPAACHRWRSRALRPPPQSPAPATCRRMSSLQRDRITNNIGFSLDRPAEEMRRIQDAAIVANTR